MRILLLYIVSFFFANSVCAQIWDFPPKPFIHADNDSLLAKNNVSKVISWNHEVVDGIETGKKNLVKIKSYDTQGNLIEEITGTGDTILYDLYKQGYWALKIMKDKILHQNVEFDVSGNVVKLTINDYLITIEYDSLNRPLIATNTTGKQIWEYQESKLVKYILYGDTSRIEERKYYYNEAFNKISYTCEYFSRDGLKYPNRDSVVAQMDSLQRPIRVNSYEFSNNEVDSTEIIYDRKTYTTIIKGNFGCTKQTIEVNSYGLTSTFYQSDCSGKLLRKLTAEYIVFN